MGLLCIVSNAEGLSENVLDTKTGWVVPKRQPEILAKKITEVINLSEAKKKVIQQNAKARIHQEFRLDQQNKAFDKFYS